MKLRVKTDYDPFEGRYYVVQKRVLLFFWKDISTYFAKLSKAEEEMERLQKLSGMGVSI